MSNVCGHTEAHIAPWYVPARSAQEHSPMRFLYII